MRIFVQSSAFLPTPATGAGAVEYLAHKLAGGLAKRGHDVHLFALERSTAPAGVELHTTPNTGPIHRREHDLAWRMKSLPPPDVLFDHSLLAIAQAGSGEEFADTVPTVTMIHGMAPLPDHAKNLVFTSRHHGRLHKVANPVPLHIGIDVDAVPEPNEDRENQLVWLGRIIPYKRLEVAMDIAARASLPLVYAGPAPQPAYHASCRRVNPQALYLGEIDHARALRLLTRSKALLFTSSDAEPAGLVMLEAAAAGCPVFAFDHGANPEFIQPGETGWMFDDVRLIASAIGRVADGFDRHAMRRQVKMRFGIDRMVKQAEAFLERSVRGERW